MHQGGDAFETKRADRRSGCSVRLFLADGTPQGLIVAEIPNWSGKVLAAPRSRLGDLLRRSEASRTGIYVLAGPDPERPGGTLAYIGEADDVAARLRIHVRSADKDFFDRLAIVVSSDENLTKAHARYLESRIIRMARQAGVVALANEREPDFQRLPEADRVDMRFFCDQLSLLLPLAGFDLFLRAPSTVDPSRGPDDVVFTFSTAGATAVGKETEDGFVVLTGSTARIAPSETFPRGYLALRDQLVADEKLVGGSSPYLYTFAADVVFTSPSAAASIVAARSASGPREWRVKETGQLYGDWRAARLDD